MNRYNFAYRVGFTPWEAYARATTASTGAKLDREEAKRERPLGRALDLGCGRGLYTAELARRGWQAVGIDSVARAIQAANRNSVSGATFVVGDITDLASIGLGRFDLFFDIGCFEGLDRDQRLAEGSGVTGLANPGATLLLLAFQPTRIRAAAGGVSRTDVEETFPDWEMLSVEPADTTGLGWPLTRTAPLWYRLGWGA
ncbi:MAG: class I SAM-dependent methyltransferase [Candidatus Nanopelagicales bacterium]